MGFPWCLQGTSVASPLSRYKSPLSCYKEPLSFDRRPQSFYAKPLSFTAKPSVLLQHSVLLQTIFTLLMACTAQRIKSLATYLSQYHTNCAATKSDQRLNPTYQTNTLCFKCNKIVLAMREDLPENVPCQAVRAMSVGLPEKRATLKLFWQ